MRLTGLKARNEATALDHLCEKEIQESAAVKIQTAFRGYLVSLFKLFFTSHHTTISFFYQLYAEFELVEKVQETLRLEK